MPKKAKCENCGHDLEIVESKPQQITIPAPETPPTNPGAQQVTQLASPPPPPEPPKPDKQGVTHEDIEEIIKNTPLNSVSCPGGNCGHQKIKNPKKNKKFKSCPNCEANTVKKGSDFCPYCDKTLDEDLEEGISLDEDEEEDE